MIMTKRQFFKRKNRKYIYSIYENIVERAYDLSQDYYNNVEYLQKLKKKYRTNTYIWDILSSVEYNSTGGTYHCSATRCQQVKSTPYKVDIRAYDVLNTDIARLSLANGKMRSVYTIVENLENNELGIRAV
jgi:hypothetical protein